MASKKTKEASKLTEKKIRQYLIDDLRVTAKTFGEDSSNGSDPGDISRDYYRANGKIPESAYSRIFGDFAKFKKAAITTGWSFEETSTVTKEDFILDFQETLKQFIRDSEEGKSSVKDMPKKYYIANSYFSGFLEGFYNTFEVAKNKIIIDTYGPSRDDLHIFKKNSQKKPHTIILTAVMPEAEVFMPGLQSIMTFKKAKNAQLAVLPMRGLHAKHVHYASEVMELQEYFVTNFEICSNLVAKDYLKFATNKDPLDADTAQASVMDQTSTIVAHPKQHLYALPVLDRSKPRKIMSTGVLTHREYFRTASHYLGQRTSTLGGIIVEVDPKTGLFWARHFQFAEDGSFQDLDVKYLPNGKTVKAEAIHLYTGDVHAGRVVDYARKATFDMVKKLHIPRVSGGDWFDGRSINPHEDEDMVEQAIRPDEAKTLEAELHVLAKELQLWLDSMPKGTALDIIYSNHDDFLNRYIRKKNQMTKQPLNYALGSELFNEMVRYYKQKPEGFFNPVRWWIEQNYPKLKGKINWFEMGEECRVSDKKICISDHGHHGAHGSRGTPKQAKITHGKVNRGHSHSPSITGDVWTAGVLALYMNYDARKPSAWQVANIVTYKDGMRQMHWVAPDGRWHL